MSRIQYLSTHKDEVLCNEIRLSVTYVCHSKFPSEVILLDEGKKQQFKKPDEAQLWKKMFLRGGENTHFFQSFLAFPREQQVYLKVIPGIDLTEKSARIAELCISFLVFQMRVKLFEK